jgi:OPA family glycerol-3-phosphate transporter-like MFS transporter 1/2
MVFRHRIFILALTFMAYTFYHTSRKPISVVKNELINCTGSNESATDDSNDNCTSWISKIKSWGEIRHYKT